MLCAQSFVNTWEYKVGDVVFATAYNTNNDNIVFGSKDYKLYCLSKDGKLIWDYPSEGVIYGIAYDDDKIFFGSSDRHLYCLNKDGEFVWKCQSEEEIYAVSCDSSNKQVFFGAGNSLCCLNWDKELLWDKQVEGNIRHLVVDPETEKIFVGLDNGSLLCVNKEKEVIWRYEGSGPIRSIFYDSYEKRILFSSGNTLFYLNLEGEKVWSYLGAGDICGVVYDHISQTIFCSCGNSSFIQLSKTGKLRETHLIKTMWHLQFSLDPEDEVLFYPSGNSIFCINYSGTYQQDIKNKFFQEFFEAEREKKFIKKMKELSVTVDYFETQLSPACPFVFKDYVYYVASNGNDYTLHFLDKDFQNHTPEKNRKIAGVFSTSIPPIPDGAGRVYFVSTKGKINFLCEGKPWHLMQETEEKYSSPTLDKKGKMYFSSTQGALYCINPNNEEIFWSKNIEEKDIYPSPALDSQGFVYFASKKNIYKIDTETQNMEVYRMSRPIRSPLKIDRENRIYFLSSKNTLTCINQMGEVLWDYHGYNLTLPAFDTNHLAYLASQCKIICLDPNQQGELLWEKVTKGKANINLDPAANDKGDIYFFAEDGKIYRKRNLNFFEKIKQDRF